MKTKLTMIYWKSENDDHLVRHIRKYLGLK